MDPLQWHIATAPEGQVCASCDWEVDAGYFIATPVDSPGAWGCLTCVMAFVRSRQSHWAKQLSSQSPGVS